MTKKERAEAREWGPDFLSAKEKELYADDRPMLDALRLMRREHADLVLTHGEERAWQMEWDALEKDPLLISQFIRNAVVQEIELKLHYHGFAPEEAERFVAGLEGTINVRVERPETEGHAQRTLDLVA